MGFAFLVGLAGLLLACRADPPATPKVEYSGCWAVYVPGPVCVLYPGPNPALKLWVETDRGTDVEIRAGGQLLADAGEESHGGRFFKSTLTQKDSSLTVRLRRPDGARSSAWSLSLVPAPSWLVKAQQLGAPGSREDLRALLKRELAVVSRREQALVLNLLAQLAQDDGRDDLAAEYLEQGIQADRHDVEKAAKLAGIHRRKGRFAEARRILAALRVPAGTPADSQYLVALEWGIVAEKVGDFRLALEQLRRAAGLAERGGMDRYRWLCGQVLARVYQELGRSQEAAKLMAGLLAEPPPKNATPCEVAGLLTNAAWSTLLAGEGGEKVDAVTPLLRRAQVLFDNNACARPDQRLNARLNLALAYEQASRWPESRQALAEALPLAAQATLDQRLWWLDLTARQEINGRNPAGGLRLYDELARVAEEARSLEGRFRAAVGRANARLALDQNRAAIAALAEAEPLIDRQSWQIPVHEGRDTFVAQREGVTRLLLQLLLDAEQNQRALDLARHDRSRLLRQLIWRDRLARLPPAEQQSWDRSVSSYVALRTRVDRAAAQELHLPGDELQRSAESRSAQLAEARQDLDRAIAKLGDLAEPGNGGDSSPSPPGAGEVILVYHPLLNDRWAALAAYPGGIQTVQFEFPSGAFAAAVGDAARGDAGALAALAQKVIEPFRSVLAGARRVRVLPYGPLRKVDFHALPLDGRPLLAWFPVVYGLDLPARPAAAAPAGRAVALLVIDPEGADPDRRLPQAYREADIVSAAIADWHGWTLKRLDAAAATAESVRTGLLQAQLFEFAGHGEYSGFAGWDSALRLAGSRLTPADLLALRRVPAWVVLATCEAGRSSEDAPGEGIGIGQAFLLAGSRAVVAAIRPVPDQTARRFVQELYARWRPGMDLPQQFQQAQLALRERYPDRHWASFRLLEP